MLTMTNLCGFGAGGPENGAGGPENDPYFANVVLLLPLTTDINDVKGHPMTAYGNAAIDSGSLLLDGTGDYLSTPDSADWDLGSEDHTIEATIRYTALTSPYTATLYGQWDAEGSSSLGPTVVLNGAATPNTLYYQWGNGGAGNHVSFAWTPSMGVWYHVAITRSGSSFKFWVNGVQTGATGTDADALFNSTMALSVGAQSVTGGRCFNGRIKWLRSTKGVARYTETFDPPITMPLS